MNIEKKEKFAIQSWIHVRNNYLFLERETGFNYFSIIEIIEYIIEESLNKKLHASNSHDLLNISTEHRYDTKADCLRIGINEENDLTFEYFGKGMNLIHDETVAKNDGIETLKNYFKKLLL